MNYYYDLLVNMQKSNDYMFYEWSNKDNLTNIKKIPIIKIDNQTMLHLYCYDVKISEESMTCIKNKTARETCLALFSDGDHSIVLEFSPNGFVVGRSRLLVEEDNNVNEIVYNMKTTKIEYQKIKPINCNKELRQAMMVKKYIKDQIEKMYTNKETIKLKYLFLEWFNYQENNPDIIINMMKNDLKKELNKVHEKISYLIKLSLNKIELTSQIILHNN